MQEVGQKYLVMPTFLPTLSNAHLAAECGADPKVRQLEHLLAWGKGETGQEVSLWIRIGRKEEQVKRCKGVGGE